MEILPVEPTGQAKIDKDILEVHKENTAAAVQNWNNFMDTILNVVKLIGPLAGMKDSDVFQHLQLSLVTPQSPTPTPPT